MNLPLALYGLLAQIAPAADPEAAEKAAKAQAEISALKSLPVDELLNQLISRLVHFSIQLAIAIIVFYAGKFIITKLYRLLHRVMLRRQVEASLTTFLLSMVRILLYFILLVTVIGILGIETSSFLALFASAGVAIGMALSGTLQNFAGGVLILLLKPYKVGDYIETQGYAGTVTEIQIFSTIINTYDNKSIILPNGGLSTGSINNWSREDYRRVEWDVSISYGDSLETARQAILKILSEDSRIVRTFIEDDRRERENEARLANGLPPLPEPEDNKDDNCDDETDSDNEADKGCDSPAPRKSWWRRLLHIHGKKVAEAVERHRRERRIRITKINRAPSVVLDKMADSSVNLKVRAWTESKNYWDLYYTINGRIYTELPASGISFPFPQMDVHLDAASPLQFTSKSDKA